MCWDGSVYFGAIVCDSLECVGAGVCFSQECLWLSGVFIGEGVFLGAGMFCDVTVCLEGIVFQSGSVC